MNIHLDFLTTIINKSFRDGEFPSRLKYAAVFPVYKNKDHLDKNIQAVNVLLHMSKIFERLVYNQIQKFMNSKLSPILTGFRKNHNTQQKGRTGERKLINM